MPTKNISIHDTPETMLMIEKYAKMEDVASAVWDINNTIEENQNNLIHDVIQPICTRVDTNESTMNAIKVAVSNEIGRIETKLNVSIVINAILIAGIITYILFDILKV